MRIDIDKEIAKKVGKKEMAKVRVKQIKHEFTDAKNFLLGKKKLIEEYQDILWSLLMAAKNNPELDEYIAAYTDRYYLNDDEVQKENNEAKKWIDTGLIKPAKVGETYVWLNPNAASRETLKTKIAMGKDIMKRYNITKISMKDHFKEYRYER